MADCVIYEEYTDTCDILRRRGKVDCSVELCIREMSFDSSTKELRLDDYYVQGITLLGESVLPGMKGSNVTLKDFSMENNSTYFSKQELIDEVTSAVIKQLSDKANFAKENYGKEENIVTENNENVNVEFEETEVDEVETKEVEIEEAEVEATEEETPVVETEASNEETDEAAETPEVVDEFDGEDASDGDGEEEPEDAVTDDGVLNNGKQKAYNIEYSVTYNGKVKNFSSSLMDKLNALYELVNSTYGEADNTWYDVDAFDEEKIVLMHDYWNGKHYRQSYQVKKDVFSLKGDRTEVFCTYLSKDEQAQLESVKNSYADVSAKLEKYESEPEKMDILNSNDYRNIAGQKDFEELKKQENHFDLTVDEVKEKADAMLLQYAKSGKLNFAAVDDQKKDETQKKDFFAFARVESRNSFLDGLLKAGK